MFKKILNQQFSSLVSGQSKNSLGSFADVNIADAQVTFAGSVITKNGSVFSVAGSGGVSDGFFAIFDNSRLNTNIALDVKYHMLGLSRQWLEYNTDSAARFNSVIDQLEYEYQLKVLQLPGKIKQDTTTLHNRLDAVTISRDSVAALIAKEPDGSDKKAEMISAFGKFSLLRDSIDKALALYPLKSTQERLLRNKTLATLKKLSFESSIRGFSFGWFSAGYKIKNNSFKLLYPSAAYAQQVLDTSFVSHEVQLQYSHYKYAAAAASRYWNIGAAFGYTDNFSALKKRQVAEKTEYGSVPDQRSSTRSYNAYQGNYQRKLESLRLYGDVFQFLSSQNRLAVHLNGEWEMKKHEKPVGNAYVGLLLALIDSKKDNGAIVNAELYYQFLDIFKTTDTEYKLFERNSIGIRFTFPIKFK